MQRNSCNIMEEKNISERIALIINQKNLSVRAFSKSVSCADTTINNIIKAQSEPGYKLLVAILENYPDLSPEWLLLGEGSQYRQKEEDTVQINKDVLEIIKSQQKVIEDLMREQKGAAKEDVGCAGVG